MTDLYDRLFPQTDDIPKIGVHTFRAAVDDYAAGYTTKAQIVTSFALDSDAQADLTKLLDHLDGLVGVQAKMRWLQEFECTCILAETGLKYTTKQSFADRVGMI